MELKLDLKENSRLKKKREDDRKAKEVGSSKFRSCEMERERYYFTTIKICHDSSLFFLDCAATQPDLESPKDKHIFKACWRHA